ncbi:MAG: ASKHA domain-containing protein [Chloroflexota bacterium]
MFNVDFEPVGRRGACAKDQSLLDCARQLNVDLVSICGGIGNCERCKVQVISGQVTRPTLEEEASLSQTELEQGVRLACQAYPLSDVKLHVPPESLTAPQRTQVEGLEVDVPPEPPVRGLEAHLSAPTLDSPIADDVNLVSQTPALAPGASVANLRYEVIDFHVQQTLPQTLRDLNWNVNVALRGNEIIALGAPGTKWLGLAVDIGTTKIAGYLLDMETGRTLASKGMMNPQISYGEDVIARIVASSKSAENAAKLQSLLTEALSQIAAELCAEVKADPTNIVEAVVVGNTAIHHLFLRLPVKQLGLAPYIPAVRSAVDIKAREIGLRIAPGAYVHLLPNVAGYVGADHVAMLLATRLAEADKTTLAIDIGTNTEICLNHRGRMTSVSCASGPAFEGAHIKFGMRAAPGAIEHVRLSSDRLEIQTIGGETPIGICGSGLLDIVAQLRLNNVLDRNGKMGAHALARSHNGATEFVLAEREGQEPITISQKDVRELQLAKAAIRLGIQALIIAEGITENDIEQVIIAGAFGTFIDVESAITIGMLPPLPLERFKQVGNAAGTGARLALISQSQRAKARQIAEQDGYIELAALPNFNRKFAEATYL